MQVYIKWFSTHISGENKIQLWADRFTVKNIIHNMIYFVFYLNHSAIEMLYVGMFFVFDKKEMSLKLLLYPFVLCTGWCLDYIKYNLTVC